MGYREFVDDDGLQWKVWDVRPAPRKVPEGAKYSAESLPGHVMPGWERGWLSFESDTKTCKRLTPIPDDWETTTDEGICRHLALATRFEPRAARAALRAAPIGELHPASRGRDDS